MINVALDLEIASQPIANSCGMQYNLPLDAVQVSTGNHYIVDHFKATRNESKGVHEDVYIFVR